jgi:hypothetical protein
MLLSWAKKKEIMAPRRSQIRKGNFRPRLINSREILQRFLIVCEGMKTEPLYFSAFKVPADVRVIEVFGTGLNPLSLVEASIKRKLEGDYDQVWCVFDVEDHPVRQIQAAISLARKNSIQTAISNQAFEIWYLLHFHYVITAIDRGLYPSLLSDWLGFPYRKNVSIFQYLISLQGNAIRNAERLLLEFNEFDPARNNPSTTVHRLVNELNRYGPGSRD